jgi:hypothetical protein
MMISALDLGSAVSRYNATQISNLLMAVQSMDDK